MFKSLIFLSTGKKEACIIKERGVGIRIIYTLPWFLNDQASTQDLAKQLNKLQLEVTVMVKCTVQVSVHLICLHYNSYL